MKRFKRQSDLVRHAIKNVTSRQVTDNKKLVKFMKTGGDFLQNLAAKIRLPQ